MKTSVLFRAMPRCRNLWGTATARALLKPLRGPANHYGVVRSVWLCLNTFVAFLIDSAITCNDQQMPDICISDMIEHSRSRHLPMFRCRRTEARQQYGWAFKLRVLHGAQSPSRDSKIKIHHSFKIVLQAINDTISIIQSPFFPLLFHRTIQFG